MVNTEFWYSETGSRAEGTNKTTSESKRWWLPSPQVPKPGLSNSARKKLLDKGKVVYQVFKATKSINENVLLEMPVPAIIKEAIPKVSFAFFNPCHWKTTLSRTGPTYLKARSQNKKCGQNVGGELRTWPGDAS